ncbi:CLUMA_CG007578, isoform A [Clunio marinus]|uniref:CLUMA_CG007578, isoform A n=1 Tax=Clunio marinus TaxID=568069 RepID=A0A1J1I564_9DIPT|nr:CLUMA_CG007578, isoform A [Clunio marinus]
MNVIKNGQLSPSSAQKLSQITLSKCLSNGTNNGNKTNGAGNTVKTERLSPPMSELSMYRSRSVTPHSHTGTPPQSAQPNNLMNNPNINSILSASQHLGNNGNNSGSQRSMELPGPPLNYSEMMRTLAAKYNSSNDLPTPKPSFIDSRVKPIRETSSSVDKMPSSPPQITPNPNLLTSLFSSLQFNQNSIFNPMLDMGSTRALVLLARAAQEAEMQKLIKGSEKTRKLPNLNDFPSTSTQMPSFNNFNPFPALTNLQALHQLSTRSPPAPPLTATSPYKSPTGETAMGVSPLDLSSSGTPPLAKRIKLSPTSTETQRQQQATSPNVTTTNNQLTTSGFSTSSSSSTTSNNSEQTGAQPARKCQMKIDEINSWNVDEVCSFVESIAICAEYIKNFREQSIDGEGLMMLTEEHLINILGMKLGPALKLRSKLVKRLNEPCNCATCNTVTNSCGEDNLMESKSFINNFTKMSIPRAGSADSAKF